MNIRFIFIVVCLTVFAKSNDNVDFIRLIGDNFVTIKGRIDEKLTNNFIKNMLNVSAVEDNIYIYMDTPGGNVDYGNKIIRTIDEAVANGKHVSCIAANYVASMGFMIFQMCPTRYVLTNTKLMQHEMTFAMHGTRQNIIKQLELYKNIEDQLVERLCNKIGMEKEQYYNEIKNNIWIYSYDAIKKNIADKIIYVVCDRTLLKEMVIVKDIFGRRKEHSKCPLMD